MPQFVSHTRVRLHSRYHLQIAFDLRSPLFESIRLVLSSAVIACGVFPTLVAICGTLIPRLRHPSMSCLVSMVIWAIATPSCF